MRKSTIDDTLAQSSQNPDTANPDSAWLSLDTIATVEITSEDPLFPIENALGGAVTAGWRAAAKGPQVIRLNFDAPQTVRRIQIHFVDSSADRSQEFAVYVRSGARSAGRDLREVRRQQFTFSLVGSHEELEDYTLDLSDVTTLELRIDPDRAHDPSQSQHYAVLKALRLG